MVTRMADFTAFLKGSLRRKGADIFIRPPKKQRLRFMERGYAPTCPQDGRRVGMLECWN